MTTTTVKRKKRSVGNITAVDDDNIEEDVGVDNNAVDKNNSSFSESLRLFQSIQVLSNEDERAAKENETAESKKWIFNI